jgi:hypothetical protein
LYWQCGILNYNLSSCSTIFPQQPVVKEHLSQVSADISNSCSPLQAEQQLRLVSLLDIFWICWLQQEVGPGYGNPNYRGALRHENVTMIWVRDLQQCP